ncbi:MAG: hypothetical protein ACR2GP_16365 [Burkholderiaceae bacterium]
MDQRVAGVEEVEACASRDLDVHENNPNAVVVAAVVVPGTKKFTSVTLLLTAVNRRCGLNTWKSLGNPNRIGDTVPALALTRKPVPVAEDRAARRRRVEEVRLKRVGVRARIRDAIPVDLTAQTAERPVGPDHGGRRQHCETRRASR